MTTFNLQVEIQSYVGHPYWPEREIVINITKESGMSRARSSANRRSALEQHLSSIGMTFTEWEKLNEIADRPFHTDDAGFIVIPKKHVEAMLVNTCTTARAAGRPCPPDMVRTVLKCSEWRTNIKPEDANTWTRYAVVSSGSGQKLSNQRALRTNQFIGAEPPDGEPTKPVTAVGSIRVNEEMVEPKVLERAVNWAGEWVGIGASRKMGWGRWSVFQFEEGE